MIRVVIRAIIAFLLCHTALGCTPRPHFYLGGIQVNEPDHTHWTATLKAQRFNTVAATVYAHQGDWDSANLWFDASNEAVINEIRAAKAEGLAVVLILRVALDHAFPRNRFLWHGMIQPKSEEQLQEWFQRYTRFALLWATIAEREGVDVFGVGSEMNSLTSTIAVSEMPSLPAYYLDREKQSERKEQIELAARHVSEQDLKIRGGLSYDNLGELVAEKSETHRRWAASVYGLDTPSAIERINSRRRLLERSWREVIAAVRSVYDGKLLYAANFDQYQEVGFWDSLDYIGVNAYFPLRDELSLSPEQQAAAITSGWQTVFADLAAFRSKNNLEKHPVIFTELGYTFRKDCTVEPWSSEGFSLIAETEEPRLVFWKKQPLDFTERVRALRGLRQASANHPGLLKGVLYWKFSTDIEHLAIEPFVHILTDTRDEAFRKELLQLDQQS